jgi:predicted Zn-dependent protease
MGGVPRNAGAEGLDKPVVRMRNTYIANGDWKFEEIFEELGDGVYLAGSRGWPGEHGRGRRQWPQVQQQARFWKSRAARARERRIVPY